MKQFKNMGQNERVVAQGTQHWAKLIFPGIIAVAFFAGFVGENFLLGLVMAVCIMLIPIVPMLTTELVLTNKRLYGKKGLINTQTLDAPLGKLDVISVSSKLTGKIFGYGSIHITTASGEFVYFGIKNPEVFRQAVMEEIDRYTKGG